MARTKSGSLPRYRLHKASGQAIVTLSDGRSGRKDYYLGLYGSDESHAEYTRIVRQWQETQQLPDQAAPPAWTIGDIIVRFLDHVDGYYRHPDGTPTTEVGHFRLSLRPLRHLYGGTPARDFDALRLQTVRSLMINGYDHPKYGKQPPLARKTINQRIGRIKKMFKWAAAQNLVPESVHTKLTMLDGLAQGRSPAKDSEPVLPVDPAVVAATLPFCSPTLAAMASVQLLTGARPGEICVLKGADLDRSQPVWVFRPREHKTAWRNKTRLIHIGPEAQAVLIPFLRDDPQESCFSPRQSLAEYRHLRQQNRKTKVQPFERRRRAKKKPRRTAGLQWTSEAYAHAIEKACKRAGQPHWSPNQLRHLRATDIARNHGIQVAQAILGHASVKTTEIYALPSHPEAQKLMSEIG